MRELILGGSRRRRRVVGRHRRLERVEDEREIVRVADVVDTVGHGLLVHSCRIRRVPVKVPHEGGRRLRQMGTDVATGAVE